MQNESGVVPVEFKVIILPDEIEEADPQLKRAKSVGLVLPDQHREREELSVMQGTLIAVGGNAFDDWKPPIPKPGDRILFARYAGRPLDGCDGKKYRVANDKDVAAIIDPIKVELRVVG